LARPARSSRNKTMCAIPLRRRLEQRQGIGQRLMEESYRAFPEIKRIQLDVEEQNPKGRAFYRKLGFEEVGIKIDDVAGTKLNSIVLEKHIQSPLTGLIYPREK
jgi:RimJ/RimL family protein N-acetyltransferase